MNLQGRSRNTLAKNQDVRAPARDSLQGHSIIGDLPRSQSISPPPPPPPPPPPNPESWTFEVIFQETSEGLPEPLPSIEDIENAPHRIKDQTSRSTAVLSDHYVAKFGAGVEPLEAENMRFVRKSTNLHVPKVFAVYKRNIRDGVTVTYIVMERIHGQTLQNIWTDLQESEKSGIAAQLHLDRSKLRDTIFWAPEPVPAIDCIFRTEDEFLDGLIGKYLYDSGESAQHRVDFYRRVLPRILKGHGKPVFTHADFQRKNILITAENTVVLLDWESSGWYPSYWEYAMTVYAARAWDDDWHVYIAKILEEFPTHFVWIQTLHIEMWGF
ncbi:phosphotransferase enzyme family [Fusarium phyllophilum]|uniref:Phosphotransferase enzyme family n=1 Tax=Fusarium phyllophilum TaxID=47803 RepID=A0A8H5IF39_9HYPO|nr:phosphotransferase enzyme family [Fusarium phyllophilum]